MTTIVCDGHFMAADSGLSYNGMLLGDANPQKIWCAKWRPAGFSFFGTTGDMGDGLLLKRWIEAGGSGQAQIAEPDLGASFCALEWYDGMLFAWDCRAIPLLTNWKQWAIGSGSQVAMGAMLAGAGAIQAARYACKIDDGSSMPVNWINMIDGTGGSER